MANTSSLFQARLRKANESSGLAMSGNSVLFLGSDSACNFIGRAFFQELHLQYNARQIYDLYLHLDIVSVKRRKIPSKNKQSRHKWNQNS
jgi:hypothetical protein